MKKILSVLLLIAMLILALASCNSKKSNDSDEEVSNSSNNNDNADNVVTTVSREEWQNAFDLSKYGNFVFTADELLGEGDSVYTVKGSTTVKNGTIRMEYTGTSDGEEEELTNSYTGQVSSFEDLGGFEILGCILYDFKASASYGYTMFSYDESSKSYIVNNYDVDGTPCTVNFWFENGKIIKITCIGYAEFQEMDATYTFSFN